MRFKCFTFRRCQSTTNSHVRLLISPTVLARRARNFFARFLKIITRNITQRSLRGIVSSIWLFLRITYAKPWHCILISQARLSSSDNARRFFYVYRVGSKCATRLFHHIIPVYVCRMRVEWNAAISVEKWMLRAKSCIDFQESCSELAFTTLPTIDSYSSYEISIVFNHY